MKKVLCIRSSSLGTELATGLDQEKKLIYIYIYIIFIYKYISIGGSSRASRVIGRAEAAFALPSIILVKGE